MGVSFSSPVPHVTFWTGSTLYSVSLIGLDYFEYFIDVSAQYGSLFIGQVVDGMLVLKKIENVPTGPHNRPKVPVVITQCGEM